MKPYALRKGNNLKVVVMELRLYAPWVHSLKEKRMVVKSLLGKIRSRYAVSAAETDEQDIHQTIVIGVAAIVAHAAQADSMMDDILAFRGEQYGGGNCLRRAGDPIGKVNIWINRMKSAGRHWSFGGFFLSWGCRDPHPVPVLSRLQLL